MQHPAAQDPSSYRSRGLTEGSRDLRGYSRSERGLEGCEGGRAYRSQLCYGWYDLRFLIKVKEPVRGKLEVGARRVGFVMK